MSKPIFIYYIEFICIRAYEKKILPEVHVFDGLFPGLQNLDIFLEKFTVELISKSFSGRNNSVKVPSFVFSNSLPHDLEKSGEIRALVSWALA